VGLLTAAQLSAIQSGAKVRQVWKIYVPYDSTHATYEEWTIHDDAGQYQCVVDAGSRSVSGFNVSMSVPGELTVGDCTFTVDNTGSQTFENRKFYPGGELTSFFVGNSLSGTPYLADPQECLLQHQIFVKVSGAWSELTGVSYKGRIVDIIFDEGGNHDGAQPGTATITAENNIAAEILRYEWKEDDADDDVTLTTIYMEGS
jgi:hypothetical protein